MDTAAVLESILFVAEQPIPAAELASLLEVPLKEVEETLAEMQAERAATGGLELRQVGGGWRLYTKPDARPYLELFASSARASRLSNAALETLAVVAYRQPVTRGQVSELRGVDSERVLQTLEARGMIAEVGRAPGPGQALLYGTTPAFLEKLGIDDLDELPPLADHVPPADVVDALERPFRPEAASSSDSRS